MDISINVSKLEQHLFHLQDELSTVNRLLCLLEDWKKAELDNNSYFFSSQHEQLKKQGDMILERIKILETLVEEFTRCIYTIDSTLQQTNYMLHSLD